MSPAPRARRLRGARAARIEGGGFEVVLFALGQRHYVAARDDVKAIRPSPRAKTLLTGPLSFDEIPMLSLSAVLGIERDTSVDRRVLEIDYWGQRLGLEVTGIPGVRLVAASDLHPLPEPLAAACRSPAVLGVAMAGGVLAVVLDLPALLAERGVEIPAAR